MKIDYLERILNANVYDVAIESPLDHAPGLSRRTGNVILLKREDLQPVFSFKLRGAYNKMSKLSKVALKQGVIAASAGNHAQGVALAAQRLGTVATLVMPLTTPQIKVNAVATRGARVLLHGESYSEAYLHARAIAAQRGLTFVHPYDDPDVIAGQGTIGMELLRQYRQPIHAIFVAIGGGGLIAGIGSYVKRLHPEVKVIGVQPVESDAMARSLRANRRIVLNHVGLFADGVAVKQVGRETFRIARECVDEVLLVDTDAICAAIKDIFEDTRSIVEPAGALGVAGAKLYAEREKIKRQTLITILCGANMNFDRLRFIAERAELGERREAVFAATIPEQPGSFKTFCLLIGEHNITEFNYRYAAAAQAHVFVGVEVRDVVERNHILRKLTRHGIETLDLTDNEMAKLHIRHLVGGRAPQAENELLYRFEFPERPGALMRFLESMGADWNITLFHYRNHGADYGRVLAGIQVPPGEMKRFREFLRKLGYAYAEETDNLAYRMFLR